MWNKTSIVKFWVDILILTSIRNKPKFWGKCLFDDIFLDDILFQSVFIQFWKA